MSDPGQRCPAPDQVPYSVESVFAWSFLYKFLECERCHAECLFALLVAGFVLGEVRGKGSGVK